MKKYAPRVGIITGATSGIGRATALELLKHDYWHVLGCGRRADRLDTLASQLGEADERFIGVAEDVLEDGVITRLAEHAMTDFKMPPSLFVLCAGRGLRGTVLSSDSDLWRDTFELNVLATLRQMREVSAILLANTTGDDVAKDIVVIGSTVGRQVSAANPVYGATKFAIHSVVESLRQELAGYNIRVTLVEPGFVQTEFQAVAEYDASWMQQVVADCGPLLMPEDIARTIVFSVSQPCHVHIDDIRIRPTRQKV